MQEEAQGLVCDGPAPLCEPRAVPNNPRAPTTTPPSPCCIPFCLIRTGESNPQSLSQMVFFFCVAERAFFSLLPPNVVLSIHINISDQLRRNVGVSLSNRSILRVPHLPLYIVVPTNTTALCDTKSFGTKPQSSFFDPRLCPPVRVNREPHRPQMEENTELRRELERAMGRRPSAGPPQVLPTLIASVPSHNLTLSHPHGKGSSRSTARPWLQGGWRVYGKQWRWRRGVRGSEPPGPRIPCPSPSTSLSHTSLATPWRLVVLHLLLGTCSVRFFFIANTEVIVERK